MKLGFGEPHGEMLHQLTQGVFLFRWQICTVVDFWVVTDSTDRSEPDSRQHLFKCKIMLFLLSVSYLASGTGTLTTLEHGSRTHEVKFVRRVGGGGEVLLVVGEDKRTTVYEVFPNTKTILHPVAHQVRHGNQCIVL